MLLIKYFSTFLQEHSSHTLNLVSLEFPLHVFPVVHLLVLLVYVSLSMTMVLDEQTVRAAVM